MPEAPPEPATATFRWGACAVLVLAVHGAALWALTFERLDGPSAPAPAIELDLAADAATARPAAPPLPQPAVTPPLEPQRPPPSEPPPEPPLSQPAPAPPPTPVRPRPPPPRPRSRPLTEPTRPAAQDRPAATPAPEAPAVPLVQAPPVGSAAPADANAIPGWQGRLVQQLQRAKRYPDGARAAGQEGVASVSFTIDRAGHVLSARVVRGSGSQALDDEALALVYRAEPLPPPPPELPGQTVTLTVPIRFSLR